MITCMSRNSTSHLLKTNRKSNQFYCLLLHSINKRNRVDKVLKADSVVAYDLRWRPTLRLEQQRGQIIRAQLTCISRTF